MTLREIDEQYERELAEIENELRRALRQEFCPLLPDGGPDWIRLLEQRRLCRVH